MMIADADSSVRGDRSDVTIDLREPDAPTVPAKAKVDPLKVVMFPARAFLALGWIRAGVEKLIEPDWWTGEALRDFLAAQDVHALPFMSIPSDYLFDPLAVPIALAVMIAQFMIGVCFITAHRLHRALWAGIVLNCVFVAMGAVTPSAFYLVIELTLLAALTVQVVSPLWLRLTRIGAAGVATLVFAPFVTTLHPAEVIDDPALMLITIALLAAAVEVLRISWSDFSISRIFSSP